jgi:hypothetical protein
MVPIKPASAETAPAINPNGTGDIDRIVFSSIVSPQL